MTHKDIKIGKEVKIMIVVDTSLQSLNENYISTYVNFLQVLRNCIPQSMVDKSFSKYNTYLLLSLF